MILILMGVCGCGKTTVGKALAKKLQWHFADADEFHSEENKQKMSSGQPLTDKDRLPWLMNIHAHISSELASGHSSVVTCSALKKHYRQLLLHGHVAKTGSGRFDGREKSQQAGMTDTHVGETKARTVNVNKLEKSREKSNDPTSKVTDVIFVHLSGTLTVLERRLANREGHFMPSSLLQSQLETLMPPDQDENSVTVDIDNSVDDIVDEIIQKINLATEK